MSGGGGDAWGERLPRGRVVAAVLAACAVVVLLHQQLFNRWWIEDAAISFAYARNLVEGEGLVAVPGGERVEGYSNPTWVLVLAVAHAAGVEGFTASKVLGTIFAILACWPTWRLARRAVHPGDRPLDLLAPVLLATSSQFAIWSASGLENALFAFLVVGGASRLVDEAERERFPASALWFLAVAWTRPEGIAYAGIAAAWKIGIELRERRGLRGALGWLALLLIPEIALVGARLAYFAWPLPNTFYAKIDDDLDPVWSWHARGWEQLRGWASVEGTAGELPGGPGLGYGWLLPVWLAGVFGLRRARAWVWGAALVGVIALLAVPAPDVIRAWPAWPDAYPPAWWLVTRIALFLAAFVLFPLLALGREGLGLVRLGETRQVARGLAFHLFAASLVFSLYAAGDWMRGYRWMSLLVPAASVVLTVGVAELGAWLGRGSVRSIAGVAVVSGVFGFHLTTNARHTLAFRADPEWSPALIKLRADYTQRVADRLFYDEPVVPLDMDMGAHLWFSSQRPLDLAGLVDIPIARHTWNDRGFVEEYVFGENQPDFAHVHGGWARTTRLSTYDAWAGYFLLPGYYDPNEPDELHRGVWMRRSLLLDPEWTGPDEPVALVEGIEVAGFDVPSPVAAADGHLYLELGLSVDDAVDQWTTVAFLAGPRGTKAWVLPPGRGLLSPGRWRRGEVFHGRWAVNLVGVEPGVYELGVVVLGGDGSVIAPVAPPQGEPLYARGEVRSGIRVRVVEPGGATAFAAAARDEAVELAAGGACSEAEYAWFRSRRFLPLDRRWHAANAPAGALAACWALLAGELRGDERVEALARAHRWDHRSPELASVGAVVGERLWVAGLAARDRGDWETAYASFRDLLRFQPWRAWARRYAEEARDHRLRE